MEPVRDANMYFLTTCYEWNRLYLINWPPLIMNSVWAGGCRRILSSLFCCVREQSSACTLKEQHLLTWWVAGRIPAPAADCHRQWGGVYGALTGKSQEARRGWGIVASLCVYPITEWMEEPNASKWSHPCAPCWLLLSIHYRVDAPRISDTPFMYLFIFMTCPILKLWMG